MNNFINKSEKIFILLILFLSLIISFSIIGHHRFHGDEALYATWGMDMARSSSIYVDKPYLLDKQPFLLFIFAIFYSLFPSKETFAEIPNIIAFIFSCYIFYIILLNFYDNKKKAILGLLLFSLLPINLLFSATAFMDMFMVLFSLLGIYTILNKRYLLAGIFFGIAIGTKSFAIFYILFYFLIFIYQIINEKNINFKDAVVKFIIGFIVTIMIAIIWGVFNSIHHKKSFYFAIAGWLGITGRADSFEFFLGDFIRRVSQWLYYYKLIFYSKIIYIPILIAIFINLILKRDLKDFIVFINLFFLLLLTSISHMPIYDRYIITFIPFVIMLSASSIYNVYELFKIKSEKVFYLFLLLIIILFLAIPIRKGIFKYGIRNLAGETIGAMYSRNDGVDVLANYILGSDKRVASICMNRDFSWIFDYYLYRAPAGYYWYVYQENYEDFVKDFKFVLNREDRRVFLLFYADNDEIDKFIPYLKKYNLKFTVEYEVYNRFNKKNMILYRIEK